MHPMVATLELNMHRRRRRRTGEILNTRKRLQELLYKEVKERVPQRPLPFHKPASEWRDLGVTKGKCIYSPSLARGGGEQDAASILALLHQGF